MSDKNVSILEKPVYNIDFAFEVGAEDHATVTLTVKDAGGATIPYVQPMLLWLSDSPIGAGLAATGAVAMLAATSGGTYLNELTTDKSAIVLTNNVGQFVLDIEDDTTQVYYVCASPLAGYSGFASVSRIMSAADFGPGGM